MSALDAACLVALEAMEDFRRMAEIAEAYRLDAMEHAMAAWKLRKRLSNVVSEHPRGVAGMCESCADVWPCTSVRLARGEVPAPRRAV